MTLIKQNRRIRGVVLTLKGWDKLQASITQAELTENTQDGFTLEELSSRMGLSLHTISRIQGRLEPVDKSSFLAVRTHNYVEAIALSNALISDFRSAIGLGLFWA